MVRIGAHDDRELLLRAELPDLVTYGMDQARRQPDLERPRTILRDLGEYAVERLYPRQLEEPQLKAELGRGVANLPRPSLRRRIGGVDERGKARCPGQDLSDHLGALRRQVDHAVRDTRDVSPGSNDTRHQPERNWIGYVGDDDRNRRRRLLGDTCERRARRDDHVDASGDQLTKEPRQALHLSFAKRGSMTTFWPSIQPSSRIP